MRRTMRKVWGKIREGGGGGGAAKPGEGRRRRRRQRRRRLGAMPCRTHIDCEGGGGGVSTGERPEKCRQRKKMQKNISTDAQKTNICLKTGYVFQIVPGKVCVWNCHFANICKLLSSEFLVLAQYD